MLDLNSEKSILETFAWYQEERDLTVLVEM